MSYVGMSIKEAQAAWKALGSAERAVYDAHASMLLLPGPGELDAKQKELAIKSTIAEIKKMVFKFFQQTTRLIY